MHVGPCGLVCSLCRFRTEGRCEGCLPGDRAPPDLVVRRGCPVLACAHARRIAYCSRDCPDFPCLLYTLHLPACPPRVPPLTDVRAPPGWTLPQPPARTQLRIFCLGPFRVVRPDGEIGPAEWGRGKGAARRVRLLLAYLVDRGPRGVRREEIFDLLWPDAPRPGLDKRLYPVLTYLRQALEPDRAPGAPSSLLLIRDGLYRLNYAACWVDADAFEAYCQQALRWEEAGEEELALACWRLAAGLVHGPYMQEAEGWQGTDEGAPWYLWRRLRIQDLYLRALLTLARGALKGARLEEARTYAEAALHQDPSCEAGYRVLMEVDARQGRVEGIHRSWARCREALRRLEDREPGPETRALYRRLTARWGAGSGIIT